MDARVLEYHWDNREKYLTDYAYLTGLYERLLPELADKLNAIHEVDRGFRYWRIILGPWLGYFIQIVFDRWSSVIAAASQYNITGTLVLRDRAESHIPDSMQDFISRFVSDNWNHYLYAEVLRHAASVSCMLVPAAGNLDLDTGQTYARRGTIKKNIKKYTGKLLNILVRDKDIFFLDTYLNKSTEVRLCLKLRQMPQFWFGVNHTPATADMKLRHWSLDSPTASEFEKFIRYLIPRQIPTAYLEGYWDLVGQTKRVNWPSRPKLIWTSNRENSDEIFKAWTADKVENGAQLVIGQHGGHYGIGKISFVEDHETAICDRYLSWGWKNGENPRVVPVGILKKKKYVYKRSAKHNRPLLVTGSVPRYSYFMYSFIQAGQYLKYLEDQFLFVETLPEGVRRDLIVRLYNSVPDFGWEQEQRWRGRFPDININTGKSDINKLIQCTKLYISTYNATTYLESISMNIPTLMYWNPYYWELRDCALPYFLELKRVGIFHETPESAARHVTEIWDHIDDWWLSDKVQDAVRGFKAEYCRDTGNLVEDIYHIFQQDEVLI